MIYFPGLNPEPPLEPPEPEVYGMCPICRDYIFDGDAIVEFDSKEYHKDCFDDEAAFLWRKYGYAKDKKAGEEDAW